MPKKKTDSARFVIHDLEQAVLKGRSMLPQMPRRWLCKFGDLRLDMPRCPMEQKQKYEKLKMEYRMMHQLASRIEHLKSVPYSGIQLYL